MQHSTALLPLTPCGRYSFPQGSAQLMQRGGTACSAGAQLHAPVPAVDTVGALLKACWRCLRWQAAGMAPGRQAVQAGGGRGEAC